MWGSALSWASGAAFAILAAAPGASAAPVTSPEPGAMSPGQASAYWTPERMREASPLDFAAPRVELAGPLDLREVAGSGEPVSYAAVTQGDTTAPGVRTHGRIFGTMGGGGFSCSGTAINSPNESTVWTAAHCIWDGTFATNLVFVPGYDVGARPFGIWAARDAYVPTNWINSGALDSRDDVGALRVQVKKRRKTRRERRRCNRRFDPGPKRRRCKRRRVRQTIVDKVGGRGIAFNQDPNDFTYRAYGYPAEPEPRFDGEHLELCVSPYTGSDLLFPANPKPIGMECDMQGGSSGGGWVISAGRVNGNVSYGYPEVDANTFYSPYFDSFTKGFYDSIKRLP